MDDHTNTSAHLLRSLETPIIQAVGGITKLDGIPGMRTLEAEREGFFGFSLRPWKKLVKER